MEDKLFLLEAKFGGRITLVQLIFCSKTQVFYENDGGGRRLEREGELTKVRIISDS